MEQFNNKPHFNFSVTPFLDIEPIPAIYAEAIAGINFALGLGFFIGDEVLFAVKADTAQYLRAFVNLAFTEDNKIIQDMITY
jgi:hypothetical protein